jgi:hypothetical protein
MDEELKAYLGGMESRLGKQAQEMESRLREHTEETETRLLREFWKWARTADARYRQNSGVVTGLDERMAIVEDRVTALERGEGAGNAPKRE